MFIKVFSFVLFIMFVIEMGIMQDINDEQAAVCNMPIDPGNCKGQRINSTTKFGYDASITRCVEFNYTGCEGNNNTFNSFLDCAQACYPAALPFEEFMNLLEYILARE